MRPNNKNRASEFGGLFLYILVGIVLFGLLMYTYTKSGNVSSGIASKGNAKVQAQAAIDYSEQLTNAVQKLQMRGISENDISFENTVFKNLSGGFFGPASNWPGCVSSQCKIFSSSGGNILAKRVLSGSAPIGSPVWYTDPGMVQAFTPIAIQNLGTAAPEQLIFTFGIPLDVCIEINKLLNNNFSTNPPTASNVETVLGDGNDSWASGKSAFCYTWAVDGHPNFRIYAKVAIIH